MKYREFWIRRRGPDDQGFLEWQVHGPGFWLENNNVASKFTHLIEHTALVDLQEKYDSLKVKADKLRDNIIKYAYEEPGLAKAIKEYQEAE